MPGRRQSQRLNGFQTQSSQKFYFKAIGVELAFKISLLGFFYFKLFTCPSDVKRPTYFRGFTTEFSRRLRHEPIAEITTLQIPTYI